MVAEDPGTIWAAIAQRRHGPIQPLLPKRIGKPDKRMGFNPFLHIRIEALGYWVTYSGPWYEITACVPVCALTTNYPSGKLTCHFGS